MLVEFEAKQKELELERLNTNILKQGIQIWKKPRSKIKQEAWAIW